MKKIFWKVLLGLCILGQSVPLIASELFSHTVLNLPFEPRRENPWSQVISTQAEWESFYDEIIDANVSPESQPNIAPAAEIDFERYQMVAGGLGSKSSGGDSVLVETVREFDDGVWIFALNLQAGSSCPRTSAVNYPSTAVLIEKTDKPINITLRELIFECD